MRRELQIQEGTVRYLRIPEKGIERFWAKIAIAPKPRPLSEITSAELIQREDIPTYRGLEVPGQFSYNPLFPSSFRRRMYGFTFTDTPYTGSQTYWDITTMPSEQQIAQVIFSGRRGRNKWIVGIDNPEIMQQLAINNTDGE